MSSPDPTAAERSSLAGTWTLDPSQTSIVFHTKALWLINVKGMFNALEGTGTVGTDGSVSGSIVLDAASVDTKNKKRDDHLRSADFFAVETNPTMTFTLTGARANGAGPVELPGALTILGTTRPVTVVGDVIASESSATVSAELDIDRSEWGIMWAKMGAGLKSHVVITARFTKA